MIVGLQSKRTFVSCTNTLLNCPLFEKQKLQKKRTKKCHLRRLETNPSSVSGSIGDTGKCLWYQTFSPNKTHLPFLHWQTYRKGRARGGGRWQTEQILNTHVKLICDLLGKKKNNLFTVTSFIKM